MPANKGMTVVDREHFNGTDISIGAQLARLKAANPQLIIAWGTGTPLGTVLRGANDIGLSVPFATSAANLDYGLMDQYANFLPPDLFMVGAPGIVPNAVTPGPLKNAALTFYDLAKATGVKPASTMLDAFDPAMLVISALHRGYDAM